MVLNSIICGNCITELTKVNSNSVDLIFADPPYFMQTSGTLMRADGNPFSGTNDNWDKFNSYNDYDSFTIQWLTQCKRVLKENGCIWVIGSFHNIYRIGYIMQNLGFWVINDVIWHKNNPVPNFMGTRLTNASETMLWCAKSKNSKYTFNYKLLKQLNNSKQKTSVWQFPVCSGKERIKDVNGKKAHNTQKPLDLLKMVLLTNSNTNDTVLDPFFGTGTTGVAAKQLKRNFIGIEQNPTYVALANNRIKNCTVDNTLANLTEPIKEHKRTSLVQLIQSNLLTATYLTNK